MKTTSGMRRLRTAMMVIAAMVVVVIGSAVKPVVVKAAVTISLPTELKLAITKTTGEQLTANVTATESEATTVTWASSDPTVATVVDGLVTPLKTGTTTITATSTADTTASADCVVTVYQPITILTLQSTYTIDYADGASISIPATVNPSDAAVDNTTWHWESNAPGVIEVPTTETNKVGTINVNVKGTGNATITVTVQDIGGTPKTGTMAITVAPAVTSVTVGGSPTTIEKTKTTTLTAKVNPPGAAYKDSKIEWKSSNDAIATVSDTGVVTGVTPGTANITASVTRIVNSDVISSVAYPITVVDAIVKVDNISLSGDTTLEKGKSTTLTATVTPDNATDKSLDWKSSNDLIATVDNTGKVTAVAAGTATITATANDGSGKTATHQIEVKDSITSVSKITITGSKTVGTSAPITLSAAIEPGSATEKNLDWSSSDPTIATVSGTSITAAVTGKKAGTATITARAKDGSGVTGTFAVEVIEVVTNMTLPTGETIIAVGEDHTLTPTLTPATAKPEIKWSSLNNAVAKVDSKGVVTGVTASDTAVTITALIPADANGGTEKKATAQIKVSADKPLIITDATLPDAVKGVVYKQKIEVKSGTVKWKLESDKPSWLSINDTTGELTGTPDKATTSPLKFKVTATNESKSLSATKEFTLFVSDAKLDTSGMGNDAAIKGASSSTIDSFAKFIRDKKENAGKATGVTIFVSDTKSTGTLSDNQKSLQTRVNQIYGGVPKDKIGIHFIDIRAESTVDGTKKEEHDTGSVQEIVIDVDFSNVNTPMMVLHYDTTDKKIEVFSAATDKKDNTFHYNSAAKKLYIYSRFFSPFVIAYPTVSTYKITFETKGGSTIDPIYVANNGSIITMPSAPTKANDTFVGWYYDSALTNEWKSTDTFTKDTTLYAKWTSANSNTETTTNTNTTPSRNGLSPANSPQTSDPIDYIRVFAALIVLGAGLVVVLGLKAKK